MDLCSTLPSSPFLSRPFSTLSSDSPGTLSLSPCQNHPAFLVTFLALCHCQSHHNTLPSDSPGSHCQSHQTFHNKLQVSHATQLQQTSHAAQPLTLIFHIHGIHGSCQELHRLYLPHLSYNIGSQVSQPRSALWYLPRICSRIS